MAHLSTLEGARRQDPLLVLYYIALLFTVVGCANALTTPSLGMQRSVDARELYRDATFGRGHLQQDGVTCLAARLSFGRETYGHVLVQELAETMQEQFTAGRVIHPNVIASRINETGLAEDYATMLATYDKTHILDRNTLRKIAEAATVRYFVVPILVNFEEGGATRISLFGMRLAKTAWATARFQLQIWDGWSGRIVWEGMSDLTLAQEFIRERPVRFEDTIQATWESILEKIPPHTTASLSAKEAANLSRK